MANVTNSMLKNLSIHLLHTAANECCQNDFCECNYRVVDCAIRKNSRGKVKKPLQAFFSHGI